MKNATMKRIITIFLVTVMLAGTSISARAEDFNSQANVNEDIARAIGEGDYGYLPAKGTLTLHPTLTTTSAKMYFWVWASAIDDTTPSGKITYQLYDPNGDYMFKRTISVGVDQVDVYALPKTGTYTLKVTSGVSEKVLVNATWSLQWH